MSTRWRLTGDTADAAHGCARKLPIPTTNVRRLMRPSLMAPSWGGRSGLLGVEFVGWFKIGCSLEFHDHFYLDRRVAWKPRHTNGGSRMFAGFTEYFHHEIGKSVDDERLVAETFGRVDHAKHLDHALDAIEAA